MPPEQDAPAHVAPPRHPHPLVDVLHQRVLLVLGERSEDSRDVCRLGAVEHGHDGLQREVLRGNG